MLEQLQHYLDLTIKGKGTTILVSGEAGVGKSRLATEFLKKARDKGVTVLAGSCLGNVSVPYFPFTEAFDAYLAAEADYEEIANPQQAGIPISIKNNAYTASENCRVLTWLSGPTPQQFLEKPEAMSPQVWRDQTFAAVARTLHTISVGQPLILFLEDIHWADSASLGLLHYLAKVVSPEKILLLATFRSEELTIDEEGHPHPLAEALHLMRRENLFQEIKLKGLDKENVGRIAESMIGGSINSELIGKLAEESQGNPLFVVETLRMLNERKSILQENSLKHLSIEELGIPSKIKEIILRRLGTLKLAQRRMLDAASAIGDKFNVELLGAILKQDSLEVLESLNFVVQSTSLVCCEEDYFRFDHAKSREIIYEEIPSPLKKGYHARIAEVLEASAKDQELPLSELAYHYAKAGNKEKATKYSMAAGKEALERFSNAEAIAKFKYVLTEVGETPERTKERLAALEGLGDAYFANSMFKEAQKSFEQLANLSTGTTKLRAFNKAASAVFIVGAGSLSPQLIKEVWAEPAADRIERARLSFGMGIRFWAEGKTAETVKVCKEAVKVFEEEYSLRDLAVYLVLYGSYCCFCGLLEEGVVALLRSISISGDLEDYRLQANNYQSAGQLIYINCGTPQEASDLIAKSIPLAEGIADYNKLAEAYCVWGWTFGHKGPKAVIEKVLKAKEYAEKTDSQRVQAIIFSTLTREYLRLEDMASAEKYFSQLMELPREILQVPGPQALKTIGMYFAAKGQWEKANEYFVKQFEFNKRLTPGAEARTKVDYAWVLERLGRLEEAKRMFEEGKIALEKLGKRFEHTNLQESFIAPMNVEAGTQFKARIDLVNASRSDGTPLRIENLPSANFTIVTSTPNCTIHDGTVELENSALKPFAVKTITLTMETTNTGIFDLNPQTVYIDDLGQTKSCSSPIRINVKPPQSTFETLPNRTPTGTTELDHLLLGGIPKHCATVLTSASNNERQQIISSFIKSGLQLGETTLYVTSNIDSVANLEMQNQTNLLILACNAQADSVLPNLPNIFKLKGVENLTSIDISLTKILRVLNPNQTGARRICIEVLSDILLEHKALATRKWLSNLLPRLKSKGFTILAFVDHTMHSAEELQATTGIFDGEIKLSQKENGQKILKIIKLYNQQYSPEEIAIPANKPS